MARGYAITGAMGAAASATKTLIGVIATTAARPAVFDIVIGSSITPADQAALYALTRFTTTGTNSAFTPLPTDASAVASVSIGGVAHSAEPGYGATDLLQIPLNLRASFRYVCSPGYEYVAPATAAFGLGLRLVSATASITETGTVLFFE